MTHPTNPDPTNPEPNLPRPPLSPRPLHPDRHQPVRRRRRSRRPSIAPVVPGSRPDHRRPWSPRHRPRHHLRLTTRGRRPGRVGRRRTATALAVPAAGLLVVASAGPALAAPPASLQEVMSRITAWLVGIAAGVATLFLTYGAIRYMAAGGDPGNAEKAKTAWRNAALGFGLALLAPLVVTILATFVS